MIICPNCNKSIEIDARLCPYCGVSLLTDIDKKNLDSQSKEVFIVKICDVCGDENDLEANICEYCGAKFRGNEKIVELERFHETVSNTDNIKNITEQASSRKTTKEFGNKKLNKNQITRPVIYFSSFLVLIVLFFILYEYERTRIEPASQIFNQDSRVDLSKLDEINRLTTELDKDPQNPDKLLNLANLNHDAGFFDKAISLYERYLNLKPNDFDAKVDMGVCFYELKNFDKAMEIFKSVIDKNPSHQIAYLNLGIVNLQLGKINEAKEIFKKCIALGEHTEAGHRAQELLRTH